MNKLKGLCVLFLFLFSVLGANGQTRPDWLDIKNRAPKDVKQFGAKGNGSADDTAAIQAAIDSGGAIFFPAGTYLISSPLEIRKNRTLTMFGPEGDKSSAVIQTAPTFAGVSMIRQWSSDWYAPGETDESIPPADLSAYSNDIDRYVNIENLQFIVTVGTAITVLDFVALQEASALRGLVFYSVATSCGFPIRIWATSTGSEVSVNGCIIEDIVCYGAGWSGMLRAGGAGSDLRVSNFVTAPTVTTQSPFYSDLLNTHLNKIHCEAFSTASPTFYLGQGACVTDSFVVVQDGSKNVFEYWNPYGSGYGVVGPRLSNINIYPQGGVSANVTNRNSINLIYSVIGGENLIVPLVPNASDSIFVGVEATPTNATCYTDAQTAFQYGVYPSLKHVYSVFSPATMTFDISDASFKPISQYYMCDIDWTISAYNATAVAFIGYSGSITLSRIFNGTAYGEKIMITQDPSRAVIATATWDSTTGKLSLLATDTAPVQAYQMMIRYKR